MRTQRTGKYICGSARHPAPRLRDSRCNKADILFSSFAANDASATPPPTPWLDASMGRGGLGKVGEKGQQQQDREISSRCAAYHRALRDSVQEAEPERVESERLR